MPNWCFTSVVIYGKKKEVQSLFSKMNNLEKRKKPLVESGFGNTWLGCLVVKLGADWEKVYCRGSWSDLFYEGGILYFNTETAWGPMTEVFDLIKQKFPSLQIYYSAEEPGCELFTTNDVDGLYFKDRYFLDSYDEPLYFETLEEAAESVSGIVGHKVEATVDSIKKALDKYMEEHEDDEQEVFYSFHEFQVS